MRNINLTVLIITSLIIVITLINLTHSCNEIVCASIVSKCMLTKSCKCDLSNNCSCCKECHNCLSYLWNDCCSCVDMCPKPNSTRNDDPSKKSHVEDIDGVPGLFMALADSGEENWSMFTFPVDFDAALYGAKSDYKYIMHSAEQDLEQQIKEDKKIITLNCTVVFMTQCLSWNKCKDNCIKMGASSYRWFHDGCCECVGSNCLNYGVNESRCTSCPESKNDDIDLINQDDWDYGDENGPMDGGDTNI